MPTPPLWLTICLALFPIASAIGGAFLGAWLTRNNDRRKQRLDFVSQQLREFYSPLLAERTHIRSIGELRVRVQNEAQEAFSQIIRDARGGDPGALAALREQRRGEFEGLIDSDNKQFRTETMPRYVEMLKIFREKFWLADESTRAHYKTLLEFVELWQRWLSKVLPPEVVVRLKVDEQDLAPFYANLESEFKRRQRMLADGDPDAK